MSQILYVLIGVIVYGFPSVCIEYLNISIESLFNLSDSIFLILFVLMLTGWVFTFKDLYTREFKSDLPKIFYVIAILGFFGIGWLYYIIKYQNNSDSIEIIK